MPCPPVAATLGAALTLADLAGPTGTSPGSSPLQGLINCLKEILVPRPQQPEAAPLLPPGPGLGLARLTGVGPGPGSLPSGGESWGCVSG